MTSSTGVLPFLRGADFAYNNFNDENFPHSINHMQGLKWLKLNKTQLNWIPEEFAGFTRLETLNLSHNNLSSLHGELTCLSNLKLLNCSHNKIGGEHIPVELFDLTSLTVLDLSHNNMTVIPRNLENCSSLTVLNLSHNNLRNISEQIFIKLTDLTHLDLSDNQLKTLPPQIGRLSNITTLILSNNPLEEHKMRQVERLKTLRVLHLANTQRNMNNIPENLGDLTSLVELDLSSNRLSRVPMDMSNLKELKRLNLSENIIDRMPEDFGTWWPNLETLNLSDNLLSELPPSLCKMCNLKRLYLNYNKLTFDGLPATLGRLHQLEIFMAVGNNLELIPESIFRCGRLKKLKLANNKLITLPDTIHLLYDLEILDLSNNPDLMIPPKPLSEAHRNNEFYNIDFSLKTQLQLAGDPDQDKLPQQQTSAIKDPVARKLRLRRRARDDSEQETNQAKVLKGMEELALSKDLSNQNQSDFLDIGLKPKKWDEILEKPPIDYSDFFDETTGQIQGLTIWEIENFNPVLMDVSLYGKFYDADCYIVLSTSIGDNFSLNWQIYFWIGSQCSQDKQFCAAFHAVGLRNHLNAHCRTVREEQGDESDEFLSLFPDGIDYVHGARTSSGFYTVEETEYASRMFRLHEVAEKSRQLHLETVAVSSNSLDSRFVFLVDIGTKIFIWNGMKSKNTIRQRARLLGEKFNKQERKNKADLVFCEQGDEPVELLNELKLSDPLPKVPFKTIDLSDDFAIESFQPRRPILYQVSLGYGYIELLQVEFRYGELLAKSLVSSNVYILDCHKDVFVWLGRRSPKLARNAALKLAQELFSMIKRPEFASITSCLQGTESQLFKTKFKDWDDVIAVDYSRTVESVSRTGANLTKWMREQKVKIDLAPLFAPLPVNNFQVSDDLQEDKLEMALVLEDKDFVDLPEEEFGHFFSADCYVFVYRYAIPEEDTASSDDRPIEDDENSGPKLTNGLSNGHANGDAQINNEQEYKLRAYFWQGRQASKMGWLTFKFSLQCELEAEYGELEVIQMHQQQEDLEFLAHFQQKFVIHQGRRRSGHMDKPIGLYHLRSNRSPLTMRCIEIERDSSKLNSGFCFLLRVTFYGVSNGRDSDAEQAHSRIFVWIGSKASNNDMRVADRIARDMLTIDSTTQSIEWVKEGEEPEEFWNFIGGRQDYEEDPSFMQHTRLFRCSNDKGYFSISEKTDFCQDDLSDDDIMILDNGNQVFLWVGPKSSEVEVKLAYKSAQVYVQNLRLKDQKPRQLMLTFKGKESRKFTKCFHAWAEHKSFKDPRGDEAKFLKEAYEAEQLLKKSCMNKRES